MTFLSPNVGGHLTQGFTCSPSPKRSQNRRIPWVPRRFPTSFTWMERVMSKHFCPRVGPSIQLETSLSYIPLDPNNPWKNEGFDPWNYGKLQPLNMRDILVGNPMVDELYLRFQVATNEFVFVGVQIAESVCGRNAWGTILLLGNSGSSGSNFEDSKDTQW